MQNPIKMVAAKLVAEGLTASSYTKAKAKRKTARCAAPRYIHLMIDGFSPEIKKAMARIRKQSRKK